MAPLPEVVAFGDSVLGKWCIKSCERVLRYTIFNVEVQVTCPLYVYPNFSTLKDKDEKMLSHMLVFYNKCQTSGEDETDPGCQSGHVLPSIAQNVLHTKDGAEGVCLRVEGAFLYATRCHCRRKVPPEEAG